MTKRTKPSIWAAWGSVLLLLFCMVSTPSAAPPLSVEGTLYSGQAQLQRGTTYIPMRDFLTFLGWEVRWDAETRIAAAEKDGAALSVSPQAQTVTLQGRSESVALYLKDGQIFLPLRPLCTLLGYEVHWDAATKAAFIADPADLPCSGEELFWLSRIIYAEAGGESDAGQIAVGNVILNRVASDAFPNTIYDVIFDKKDAVQFEPVSNGTVYNLPSAAAVRAAKAALRGENTAGDSLFFFNPNLSSGSWIVQNRTFFTAIGSHHFYC